MTKFTYAERIAAHLIWADEDSGDERRSIVTVPDQVGNDQKEWDGKPFPLEDGEMVALDGNAYALWGSGTGDMIVRPV